MHLRIHGDIVALLILVPMIVHLGPGGLSHERPGQFVTTYGDITI
jgi:hypothetical protein